MVLRVLSELGDDQPLVGGIAGSAVRNQQEIGFASAEDLHGTGQAAAIRSGAALSGQLLCRGAAEGFVQRPLIIGLLPALEQVTELSAFQFPAEIQKLTDRNVDLHLAGLTLSRRTGQIIARKGEVDPAKGKAVSQALHKAVSGILSGDLILIAVRPDHAVQWVKDNAEKIGKNAIVVDLCGVKRCVSEAIKPIAKEHGFRYIGGHPMAGKEVAGYNNATAHLYDGAAMILTPDENSDLPLLETLRDLFYSLGFAKLTFSTPEEHDRIIAYTSQLAHIASNAYIKSPESQEQFGFSAGSFRDMTRVARLDENMWTVLMMDNVDFLSKQVDILIANLQEYQSALHDRDAERLRALLKEGREMKERAGGR